MKRFAIWLRLKEKLHGINHAPPMVSERDIWWASIGENVGSEVNGKSDLFSRPVIILKKLSHTFYFVIPTTTQSRSGSWYVGFVHQDREMFACLHQARAIDYRRLSSRLGKLDGDDFAKIKAGFRTLYKSRLGRTRYAPRLLPTRSTTRPTSPRCTSGSVTRTLPPPGSTITAEHGPRTARLSRWRISVRRLEVMRHCHNGC